MIKLKCPNCGFDNEKIAKYCEKCGTPLTIRAKKKKWPWIVLFVLILIVALTISVWFFFLKPNEKSYDTIMEKAEHYVMQLDYSEAESLYLEAIEIEPKRFEAYLALSQVYVEQESYEQAMDILEQAQTKISEEDKDAIEEQIEAIKELQNTSIFVDIAGEYVFSSGAGGWSTSLTLHEDGSFEGAYQDSDMGDAKPDYPHGTIYYCNFSGKFATPVKDEEYLYTMHLDQIEIEGEVSEVNITDGIRYIVSKPMGLEDGKEWEVYLQGTPLSEMPEELIMWLRTFINPDEYTELPYVGLYNPKTTAGFFRYE